MNEIELKIILYKLKLLKQSEILISSKYLEIW